MMEKKMKTDDIDPDEGWEPEHEPSDEQDLLDFENRERAADINAELTRGNY